MSDLFGQEKMLALSWKQPFGTAMLAGKVETRVWNTSYRGLVLICTSKTPYNEKIARSICGDDLFDKMCISLVPHPTVDLDGYAIAVGRLVNAREMRPEDSEKAFVQYRAPWTEHREGKDWIIRPVHLRLYCHFYEDVRAIEPFPWKGCQGWKEVDDVIKAKIKFK